jgi:phospholipid/cholesterol/gamma-HCH transport system ATP-binding protein
MNYKKMLVKEAITNKKIDYESSPVVEIKDLKKHFGDNKVLKGFNLKLHSGECIAVLGKSGSGKSVLIKCLVGLLPYDAGSLKVLGKEVAELTQQELDELRTEIGFLFQGSALYDSMTVKENLEFPLRRHMKKLDKGVTLEQKIKKVLESVGLAGTENLMPEELSGGMKKRIALARTLIINPKIILYDEPTSGLDPITTTEISDLILEIQKEYMTSSIVITHDVDCARKVADKLVMLVEGVNFQEGSYDELCKSEDERVNSFFK